MRYLILIVLFLLAACGSGGSNDQLANIQATDSASVAVTFGNSDDDSEFDIDNDSEDVIKNCQLCCLDGIIGAECLESLNVSCAPEDFNNTECEES